MPDGSGPLARSAGLAGAATLASRILGLIRDQIFAALFGAGNQMDAFVIAYRLPNLVRDLFAEGAMSAAFVPTFTRQLMVRGRLEAWRLGNNLITTLVVATAVVVAIGIVFAEPLVTLVAADFAVVPGKLELTVQLTRVMLPFLTLVALAAALMGMLNSLHYYFVPALAPAAFNVAIILSALVLVPVVPRFGLPAVSAIAIGVLVGGLGQIAVQWWTLRREGFRYRPLLDLRDEGLRRVLVLIGPGTIGLAATQANVLVSTLLATSQGPGAASWLTYAFRLMYLPIGLFGVSIATAVLPAAAIQVAAGKLAEVRSTLGRGLSLMLMLNIPATIGLAVLATPIVRLIFEHGAFAASDTEATATALQLYAVGLVGYSAARIASPAFYALGRSHVPVAISVGSMAVNLVASLVLARLMGFRGLALSTSIAALVHGGTAMLLLRGELRGLEGKRLAAMAGKITTAAIVMAGAAVAAERALAPFVPLDNLLAEAMHLGAAIGIGLCALGASAKILRIREFDDVIALVRERTLHARAPRP